jgi:UDP-N-acetylglucosamine 2-epimerase
MPHDALCNYGSRSSWRRRFILGKTVLVIRETTQLPEALKTGTSGPVGTDQNKVISETELLLLKKETYLACRQLKILMAMERLRIG